MGAAGTRLHVECEALCVAAGLLQPRPTPLGSRPNLSISTHMHTHARTRARTDTRARTYTRAYARVRARLWTLALSRSRSAPGESKVDARECRAEIAAAVMGGDVAALVAKARLELPKLEARR